MLRVFLVLPWLRWSLGVTSDFLNCDWDQDWRSFRRAFAQNARAGYPVDAELQRQAQELLQSNWGNLQPDDQAGLWLWFFGEVIWCLN